MAALANSSLTLCYLNVIFVFFPTDIKAVTVTAALVMVNIPISLFGTLTNSLIIMAYYRNLRLRTIQNKIFFLLAITDFGVTAFVQPVFLVATLNGFFGNDSCILWGLSAILSLFFVELSLIATVILSLESYITLAYPYHWQTLITKNRLNIVFGISWTLILIKTLTIFQSRKLAFFASLCIACLTVITVILIWTWTYKLVARHQNAIHSTQTPSSELVKRKKILQSTTTAFAVISCLLSCNFLNICFLLFTKYLNPSRLGHDVFSTLWSATTTLTYLNSLLNPCLRIINRI